MLLEDTPAEALLADKAYDADERVRQRLEEQGCEVVIPPKANRKAPHPYDQELYKARHLIENFWLFRTCYAKYEFIYPVTLITHIQQVF